MKKMSALQLWDTIIAKNHDRYNSTSGSISHSNFYYDELGFYSGVDNVTYLYTIDGYPSEVENSLRYNIRSECRGDTSISFLSILERHKIEWGTNLMKLKLRSWKILDEDQGEVTAFNLHESIDSLDSMEWKKQSLVYLNDAVLRRKRQTFRFRCLVLVQGKRGTDFEESIMAIEDYCAQRKINLTRVLFNIPDYVSMFSPFKLLRNPKLEKEMGNVVLTDELLSRFTTFSQGKIGKRGDYWGTDIFSCFSCLKPTKAKETDSETWLFTGETGSGKSYFGKGILLQLLAKPFINGTINDVEGFEYLGLVDLVETSTDKVVVLNMAEGQGLYYDPVPIILTGESSSDRGMYAMSVSYTSTLFRTLVGVVEVKVSTWVDVIINDAISNTYGGSNVKQKVMSSWSNSENLSMFDVYANIKGMLLNNKNIDKNDIHRLAYDNADYYNALQVVVARLSRYFDKEGTLSGTFANKISIKDIAYAKLVINSFGMAGKSPDTVDPVQLALMQLYASFISHIRSMFSKAQGRYNFKVWEEFQRWGSFPNSERIISTALTGGRKLGDINIIMTNKVGDILKDDKFGIFGNINSVAIGCIWDSKVRHELCERLSMLNFEEDLDMLVRKNKNLLNYVDGDTVQDSAYNKAFLVGLDKTFFTVSKMVLTDELDVMPLFQTGIELRLEDEDE